jgi:hypothetical protein
MKATIKILLLSLILQSFQCEENELNTSIITLEQLSQKKQEVLDYINSFTCNSTSSCNYIAFGAKPCGGPREYLVFPNSINQNTLQRLVDEYYEMEHRYNIQTNAVSDCMIVNPPTNIDCIDGNCLIIN